MSNSAARLRGNINSAEDLKSVVRTMKSLAASSIGQYERSVRALTDYYRTVELGLGACLRQAEKIAPLPHRDEKTAPGPIGAVVFGSDQGLVGKFNEEVVDYAIQNLHNPTRGARVWAVGERAGARLADAGQQLQGRFMVPNSVQGITALVGQILVQTEAHTGQAEIKELLLFHNRPTSGSIYAPVRQRLLPLDETWLRTVSDLPWPSKILPEVIGDRTAVLRSLIREYLFISIFRACAESLATENASRLSAMERADKNIDDLLENLRGSFQRLRQGDIDEELFDVISGFEALENAHAKRRID